MHNGDSDVFSAFNTVDFSKEHQRFHMQLTHIMSRYVQGFSAMSESM